MYSGTRKASVEGLFYPKECAKLKIFFREFDHQYNTIHIPNEIKNIIPKAIIVPHAGYIFSGFTASLAYQFLKQARPARIIVIGPSHHHHFKGISGSFFEDYETPCGNIKIDSPYLFALAQQFNIGFVPKAHQKEHSTEVQMPFIQHYFSHSKVIELIYSEVTAETLAKLITILLQNADNALVISSDLSHFYTIKEANKRDEHCLKAVSALEINKLEQGCEACGLTGIKAMIHAAKYLKLSSKLLDYRTSAWSNNSTNSVVGYMSALFY